MSRKEYKINEAKSVEDLNKEDFVVNGCKFSRVKMWKNVKGFLESQGWMLYKGKLPVTNDVYENINVLHVERADYGKLNSWVFKDQNFILCNRQGVNGGDIIYSVDQKTGELCQITNGDGYIFQSTSMFHKSFPSLYVSYKMEGDVEKYNILTPDGFMFNKNIDYKDTEIQEKDLFEQSGLVAVQRDGKLNIIEDKSLIPVLKEFAEDIIEKNNPFNYEWPLLLVKYEEGACDIIKLSTLKPIFNKEIEDIYTNEDGYIFFKIKGKTHLFISENEYIKCNNCVPCFYGELLYLDDGYIFYYNGKLSDRFDEVYDVKSLFPVVCKNGKFNFLERTKGKPVFNEWFDDVDEYEGGNDVTYNNKTHKFTVYNNGKKEILTYSPSRNFSIA